MAVVELMLDPGFNAFIRYGVPKLVVITGKVRENGVALSRSTLGDITTSG